MTLREASGTMSTMTVMPHGGGEWTVDDLDAIPDDGLQYELLDGLLLVTPAPVPRHQLALVRLLTVVDAAARAADALVLPSPIDWRPHRTTSLQPDLVVLRRADYDPERLSATPVLVIEVLSPSTRRKDLLVKRDAYQEGGIGSYWIVDPDEPSLTALDLLGGTYVETARANGAEPLRLTRPFDITVVPADLVRP